MNFRDPTEQVAYELLANRMGRIGPMRPCYGPSISKTKADQSSSTVTATATDSGVVVTGGKNIAPGAAGTEGNNSPILGGSQIIGGGGNITLTTADTVTLEKGLEAVGNLAAGFGDKLTELLTSVSTGQRATADNQQANLSSVLGSIAALAESKQTEGASQVNKNILYVALGLLAVVAAGLYFFRRR